MSNERMGLLRFRNPYRTETCANLTVLVRHFNPKALGAETEDRPEMSMERLRGGVRDAKKHAEVAKPYKPPSP